ncbi:MAG TPA: metallophosphoesterase [Syntrophales bacterium]|nr:metallophosphoesterase [Syntrophales bacterium]
MSLFLLTFFLIYGGVHLYLFAKIRVAFHPGVAGTAVIIVLLVLMILAPILVRMFEKYGHDTQAGIAAYTGYLWMGLIFLFFITSLLLDVYHLLIHTGALVFRKDPSGFALPPLYAFLLPLIISLGINIYGYFEARNIRTENITISSPKIPEEKGRIRIVQISDVHIGIIVTGERLRHIVEEVKKTDPDILVSTGDLVDGQIDSLGENTSLLREMQARYGKFAITGNHEFYAGLSQALDFTRRAGFTMLRGEGLNVAGVINIAGVDDPTVEAYEPARNISEKDILSRLPGRNFTVLLKHRPAIEKGSVGLFDLQLSGHTHNGQIFPFRFVTWLFYPLQSGYFNPPTHNYIRVNRGTGTWGPPIRFLAPPEITVIDLINEKRK